MIKYEHTLHAKDKLKSEEVRKLKITKRKIQNVIKKPIAIDKSEEPVIIAIGNLSETLSLCVAYKEVEGKIRIITFWPAEKGRYERKVLQKR